MDTTPYGDLMRKGNPCCRGFGRFVSVAFSATVLFSAAGCEFDGTTEEDFVVDPTAPVVNNHYNTRIAGSDFDGDGVADTGTVSSSLEGTFCHEEDMIDSADHQECLRTVHEELRGMGDCLVFDQEDTALFCSGFPGYDSFDDLIETCATTSYSVCGICVNQFATEVADGVDNNCDGEIDEGFDPCEDVTCDAPPADSCSDDVLTTASAEGVCAEGECSYEETTTDCSFGCNDEGTACAADPCDGVTCDAPPADSCSEGSLTTASAEGTCSEGSCSYVETVTACDFGCNDAGDACAADPCDGVTCDAPPADSCSEGSLTTASAEGTCSEGSCSYVETVTACDFGCNDAGDACAADPCIDFVCDAPPAPICDDSADPSVSVIAYEAVGTCDSGTGVAVCSYDPLSAEACDLGLACETGACAPVMCDPRLDFVFGEDAGDCADYRPSDEDIAALGGGEGIEYGFGCIDLAGTYETLDGDEYCGLYEDVDSDEIADAPEYYCADGVDGDLDGDVDVCAEGDLCLGGICTSVDACDAVSCDAGEACFGGACYPTNQIDMDGDCFCPPNITASCVGSVVGETYCPTVEPTDCDELAGEGTWSWCTEDVSGERVIALGDGCPPGYTFLAYTDGAALNNSNMHDYVGDGFDNDCDGRIDETPVSDGGNADPCDGWPSGPITCTWF